MFCEANQLKKICHCGHRISFLNTNSRRWVLLRNAQMLKSTKFGGWGGGSGIKNHTTAVFTQVVFELYNNIVLDGNIKF